MRPRAQNLRGGDRADARFGEQPWSNTSDDLLELRLEVGCLRTQCQDQSGGAAHGQKGHRILGRPAAAGTHVRAVTYELRRRERAQLAAEVLGSIDHQLLEEVYGAGPS